jgi:hypothetical protein
MEASEPAPEIPEGATVSYNEVGEVIGWSLPPETPEGELHPRQVPGYEPHFDRMGTHRRVLGHITDEDHVGRGPRNNPERLGLELGEDPFTAIEGDPLEVQPVVQKYLDELVVAGLVEPREDGTYVVTEAGQIELAN